MKSLLTCFALLLLTTAPFGYAVTLEEAVASPDRDAANAARDGYRHPLQTLTFFGVRDDSTVVEVWPGGGWYVEVLAPYLRDRGVYYAAAFATTLPDAAQYMTRANTALADKLASKPAYDHVVMTELNAPQRSTMAPPGRVDFVLTFRNVHNWLAAGNADAMMAAFHRALKSGGVLGIVEHRAKAGTSLDVMKKSGYVTEQYVIDLAAKAGFKLMGRSEINANAQDSADHPAGVWSLPPNLRVCQPMDEGAAKTECVARYAAIGESDRMTLKFSKP